MTDINQWIDTLEVRLKAIALRGVELAHIRRCICAECEALRSDLPRALKALRVAEEALSKLTHLSDDRGFIAGRGIEAIQAILEDRDENIR